MLLRRARRTETAPATPEPAAPQPEAAPAPAPDPTVVRTAPRTRMMWALAGSGVELGPGHHPYPLPVPGASVRYVDRWEPSENEDLFPELGEDPGFPEPDIKANFDTDGLSPLPDESQDFVIASHVLEHLADPIGMLAEIERVLKPGGYALVLLPDKRFTFDAPRDVTPLEHLVEEHAAKVTEVSDEHVREFVTKASVHDVPADESEWPEVIELHRRRSIHVHCWTETDFPPVLVHAIRELGQRWELADVATVAEGGPGSFEFGYLLRRTTSDLGPDVLAERFEALLHVMAGTTHPAAS